MGWGIKKYQNENSNLYMYLTQTLHIAEYSYSAMLKVGIYYSTNSFFEILMHKS